MFFYFWLRDSKKQSLRIIFLIINTTFVEYLPNSVSFLFIDDLMIGLINHSIELKVFTINFQWFKHNIRSGAESLVMVLD